jgi:hypothetical protein
MERATIQRRTAVQGALATVAALVLGVGSASVARAKVIRAHGAIADRVRSQRDVCEIDGGTLQTTTFTQPPRPKGQQTTQTRCNGGSSNGYTCTNTVKYTSCGYYDIRSPEDDGLGVGDLAEDLTPGGYTVVGDPGAPLVDDRAKRRRAQRKRR